jgi:hypothetical protein
VGWLVVQVSEKQQARDRDPPTVGSEGLTVTTRPATKAQWNPFGGSVREDLPLARGVFLFARPLTRGTGR